jgi:hypothetical protein
VAESSIELTTVNSISPGCDVGFTTLEVVFNPKIKDEMRDIITVVGLVVMGRSVSLLRTEVVTKAGRVDIVNEDTFQASDVGKLEPGFCSLDAKTLVEESSGNFAAEGEFELTEWLEEIDVCFEELFVMVEDREVNVETEDLMDEIFDDVEDSI